MAWGWRTLATVCAVVGSVHGADKDEAWADVASQENRANSTAVLHVQNRAAVPVRLMGCKGTEVQPNQTVDVPMAGLVRFWVVPQGASFDCHAGPFDGLFYVAADLLGQKPVVTVGFGTGAKQPGGAAGSAPPAAAGENATNASSEAEGAPNASGGAAGADGPAAPGVVGLQLSAGPPGSSSGEQSAGAVAVRCRPDKCGGSREMAAWPGEFTLTVMGPQASPLSFWYGGGWGWRHPGWGGYGWGHRRWGWGGPGWGGYGWR